MKIAAFNVNNINKRLQNLLAWLRTSEPEIVCLQELKAEDREFPKAAIEKAGYRRCAGADKNPGTASPFWRASSRTYRHANGTARRCRRYTIALYRGGGELVC